MNERVKFTTNCVLFEISTKTIPYKNVGERNKIYPQLIFKLNEINSQIVLYLLTIYRAIDLALDKSQIESKTINLNEVNMKSIK